MENVNPEEGREGPDYRGKEQMGSGQEKKCKTKGGRQAACWRHSKYIYTYEWEGKA